MEETIKKLSQYKFIQFEINALKECYNNSLKGSGRAEEKAFLKSLEDSMNKLLQRQKKIESAVNCIDDDLYKTILKERFINGLMWFQIAQKVNYSTEHIIQKIYPKALKTIKL